MRSNSDQNPPKISVIRLACTMMNPVCLRFHGYRVMTAATRITHTNPISAMNHHEPYTTARATLPDAVDSIHVPHTRMPEMIVSTGTASLMLPRNRHARPQRVKCQA